MYTLSDLEINVRHSILGFHSGKFYRIEKVGRTHCKKNEKVGRTHPYSVFVMFSKLFANKNYYHLMSWSDLPVGTKHLRNMFPFLLCLRSSLNNNTC